MKFISRFLLSISIALSSFSCFGLNDPQTGPIEVNCHQIKIKESSLINIEKQRIENKVKWDCDRRDKPKENVQIDYQTFKTSYNVDEKYYTSMI